VSRGLGDVYKRQELGGVLGVFGVHPITQSTGMHSARPGDKDLLLQAGTSIPAPPGARGFLGLVQLVEGKTVGQLGHRTTGDALHSLGKERQNHLEGVLAALRLPWKIDDQGFAAHTRHPSR